MNQQYFKLTFLSAMLLTYVITVVYYELFLLYFFYTPQFLVYSTIALSSFSLLTYNDRYYLTYPIAILPYQITGLTVYGFIYFGILTLLFSGIPHP